MQRQRGGGGVLGAATGSDAEDGDEPLVLDSVQLKVSLCLVAVQPCNQQADYAKFVYRK